MRLLFNVSTDGVFTVKERRRLGLFQGLRQGVRQLS